jgi:hypothetical protein
MACGCCDRDPFEDALDGSEYDMRGTRERARDLLRALGVRLSDPEDRDYGSLGGTGVGEASEVEGARETLLERLGPEAVARGDGPGSSWACERLLSACLVLLTLDRYDLRVPRPAWEGDSRVWVA